mmetsp:Transcript_38942/g.57906  ORF Transcript_38942/g.57906 Transcript_38942/m.57906 type:complete len:90 (-) Transcript_38942:145-414(-)
MIRLVPQQLLGSQLLQSSSSPTNHLLHVTVPSQKYRGFPSPSSLSYPVPCTRPLEFFHASPVESVFLSPLSPWKKFNRLTLILISSSIQ